MSNKRRRHGLRSHHGDARGFGWARIGFRLRPGRGVHQLAQHHRKRLCRQRRAARSAGRGVSVVRAETGRDCSRALLQLVAPHAGDDWDCGTSPTLWPSFRRDIDRGTTMGTAKYIGCVGVLAVALGIGISLATTPAVACAEPVHTVASSSPHGSSRVSSSSAAVLGTSDSPRSTGGSNERSTGSPLSQVTSPWGSSHRGPRSAQPGVVASTGGARTGSETSRDADRAAPETGAADASAVTQPVKSRKVSTTDVTSRQPTSWSAGSDKASGNATHPSASEVVSRNGQVAQRQAGFRSRGGAAAPPPQYRRGRVPNIYAVVTCESRRPRLHGRIPWVSRRAWWRISSTRS